MVIVIFSFIGFIADQGVNCVRVRVWNNPYDSQGNGFGGGNNDVAGGAQASLTIIYYWVKSSN